MSTTKRKVESGPKKEDILEEKPSVIETPNYKDAKVRKQVKKSADTKLFSALAEVGFHPNEWHFEPKYIRFLLQTGSLSFGLFTVVSFIQANPTSASIPYTAFEFEEDKSVDHYWLADALEEQFETALLLKK